jgi:hypothetical protein
MGDAENEALDAFHNAEGHYTPVNSKIGDFANPGAADLCPSKQALSEGNRADADGCKYGDAGEGKSPSFEFTGVHAQFSQAGTIDDLSLTQLRDHIKKVMIPLLIKSFQLKLELSQATSLPSRLQSLKHKPSSEEIIEQLKQLDKDLQVLMLWCQSCRNQIQKAIVLPEEESKTILTPGSSSTSNPAVSKSFTEAVTAQSAHFKNAGTKETPLEEKPIQSAPLKKKHWWDVLFRSN